MGLSLEEQETVVNYSRTDERASIYTSDSTVMTKLNKLVETAGADWKLDEIIKDRDGVEVARNYSCPKKYISYRSKSVTRELTEEQRKEQSERMKAMRNSNRVSS